MRAGEPPPDGAEAQAEWIAALTFMAARGGQLVFSALMIANDRRRYRSSPLQAAVLAGVIAESGWLAARIIRARRYDDRLGVWIDVTSAAAALLVSQHGVGAEGGAAWAKNVAIGAAIGAASTRRAVDTAGTVGALCAAAIRTGVRGDSRDAHVAGLALSINDAVSWAGTHIASRVYLNAHRRYGRLRDEADALAVDRAQAAAAEAERGRQHERLHETTISVLSRIACSDSLGPAVAEARAETVRLRYALRTGGSVPEGLDQALADIAEAASATGLRVELVTAELHARPRPEAMAALRTALWRSVDAAREFGGARRAVVRAVSDAKSITVTVRDHGLGFLPGAGSAYECRLLALREVLVPCGGAVATWSEPGGGVRVTMTLPTAAPDGTDAETASLQGSPQRLPASDDLSLDGPIDRPGGVPVPRSRAGRTTPFSHLPAAQARIADHTLLTALLAWRATGLVTGAAALVAGRSRYRSRGVAVAQLALAAGESAWYAWRVLRADRWCDPLAAHVDAATAAAVLLLSQANLATADYSTWINWPPWTFAANVICGQAMGTGSGPQACALAGAVVAVNAAQSQQAGDALANSVGLLSFFTVARLFGTQIRGGAVHLAQTRERALLEGRHLAQAQERSVQLRLLHDHALQTLETIASGRFTDLHSIQIHALTEAARLRLELDRTGGSADSFADRLQAIVARHAERGLLITFACPVLPRIAGPLIDAFCGATDEALTNVSKHAGTSEARVTVRTTGNRIVVTVADEGAGFDQSAARGGFGLRESMHQRMADAGGRARVTSVPGNGTCVTLTGFA